MISEIQFFSSKKIPIFQSLWRPNHFFGKPLTSSTCDPGDGPYSPEPLISVLGWCSSHKKWRESGDYDGNMMELWWNFDGIMMELWWNFDGIMMELWWNFDGFVWGFWWNYDGILMEFWWNYDGIMMELWWNFDGIMMELWWNFDGIMMELWWNFDGNMMEFSWICVGFWWIWIIANILG